MKPSSKTKVNNADLIDETKRAQFNSMSSIPFLEM